jgi:alkylated DNA repair dioxygenase AlkB
MYRLLSGWRRHDTATLSALRSLFTYTDREPGRATGWLYCSSPVGQLGLKAWPPPMADIGPELLAGLAVDVGEVFTACCFQAYLNGTGCAWHYDREWGAQAILSLGVDRTFSLRPAGGSEYNVMLHHGDLLYMPAGMQDEWEHCVPVEQVQGERCSLVFRTT